MSRIIMDNAFELPSISPKSDGKKPLLGLTILLVEDSRFFSDTVRLLSIKSGARIRRADSLSAAQRHIRIYCPDVVIVDLNLPDGSGVDFISEIANVLPNIIAVSGMDYGNLRQKALNAGARLFLEKPFDDLASFQQSVLSVVPELVGGKSFTPRLAGTKIEGDQEAMEEDLQYLQGVLSQSKGSEFLAQRLYCANFAHSLGQSAGDEELATLANGLKGAIEARMDGQEAIQNLEHYLKSRLS